jgi:hypothetical protein
MEIGSRHGMSVMADMARCKITVTFYREGDRRTWRRCAWHFPGNGTKLCEKNALLHSFKKAG